MDRGLMKFCKPFLTKENYKLLQKIEDDDLRDAFLKAIAKVIQKKEAEGLGREEIKEFVNKTLEEILEIVETFNKAIDLTYLKIEKLKRLRKGVILKGFELGAEKLQEIKAKVEARS